MSNGKRLTGLSRYTEVLERYFSKFFFTNILTLIGFLPFTAGVVWAILSSSFLIMILTALIGGIFVGPALSCMYDAVFRGLRDVAPDFRHAWTQNWKQSILPGILFCLLLGTDIFMAMLFWWASSFPGWGTIALYLFSIFMITMFFSIIWPQIILFDQTLFQNIRNSLLFILLHFPRTFGAALLQILYWGAFALFLPWSLFLLPLTGFWFSLYTTNFLLYDTLNDCFQIEKRIAEAFPEQAPFYEDDDAWLRRKQQEGQHDQHSTDR